MVKSDKMAEHWKSTPSYWCKFCSIYVRDTTLERKNHEASFKHQNNIQRGLRDLHKNKERELRDQQRAKSEIARINGLVDGKGSAKRSTVDIVGLRDEGKASAASSSGSKLGAAAQRKLHAEQLIALGVELPEELKREVQGVGGWQVVSERPLDQDEGGERSLAEIIKEEQDVKHDSKDAVAKGVHKRKAENGEDEIVQHAAHSRAWGSRLKTYPGTKDAGVDDDLDALLGAVSKKSKQEEDTRAGIKEEEGANGDTDPLGSIPDIGDPTPTIKQEDSEAAAPAIIFKKRKVKR